MRTWISILFMLVIALMPSAIKAQAVVNRTSIKCMGVELDGSQTLRVIGYGKNRTDAKEQAMNDSLRAKVSDATAQADASFALGQKHDEGYEVALLDAFNGYAHAIGTAAKMTANKVDTKPIVAKKDKTKAALQEARKELADKKKLFTDEGMADIAAEFDKRIKRIDGIH